MSIVWAFASIARAQETPPGERGRWVHGVTPVVSIEDTLEDHGSVRWMTEDRWQFVLARLESDREEIRLLRANMDALKEENLRLWDLVHSLEDLCKSRREEADRLELDLRKAENTLTRLPKRKKLWVITGAVLGGSATYLATR